MSTYIPEYIRYATLSDDQIKKIADENKKFIDLANTELQLRYCKYLMAGFTVEEAKSRASMEVIEMMLKGELK